MIDEANDETVTLAKLLNDKGAHVYKQGGGLFIFLEPDEIDEEEL